MLIDICPLRDELDILELRIRELAGIVDQFIVVQAEETHAGDPKPILFNPEGARWQPWAGRLSTVILPRLRDVPRWTREHAMRDAIAPALRAFSDRDYVLMSDVDEIPNAEAVELGLSTGLLGGHWAGFATAAYYYYLNLRVPGIWRAIALARVETVRRLGGQAIRDLRTKPPLLLHGGWHFSYLGGVDAIQRKIAAFAHAEFDTDAYRDPERIAQRIHEHRDLYDVQGHKAQFSVVSLDELPRDVRQRPEAYALYLYQPVPA